MAFIVPLLLLACGGGEDVLETGEPTGTAQPQQYAGSLSCRQCHERFYDLWSTSHHGLAMQPFTPEFADTQLHRQNEAIRIKDEEYRFQSDDESGWVLAKTPEGEIKWPVKHVLGGKNVYYLLTEMERGKLQTLPVAYNVQTNKWFDMAQSGVRHFSDMEEEEEPFHWTDWPYTFNANCHSCHVSQYASNYDLATDTYETSWLEPGINCETCHGSCEEHVRVFKEAEETGETPAQLHLVTMSQKRGSTPSQANAACSSCHAKGQPISTSFQPGDEFFDHFGLVTLENPDYYPDGRDLGENYTYTSWRMSPCVKASELDCIHCHTSSGRYRFAEENVNGACLPCHESRVNNVTAHSMHEPDSTGSACVGCHMPKTSFAGMMRSDHSMRPPTPATSVVYQSPNACTICHEHQEETAAWADGYVREWRSRDYQQPVLHWAGLIDEARKEEWARLSDMLAYLQDQERDEIVAASLIRLLQDCDLEEKWPALIGALKDDSSPLVRASAAEALNGYLTEDSASALLSACGDEYRLVRVRAAASLASLTPGPLSPELRQKLNQATVEYLVSLTARPDDSFSHYNLGNFYMMKRQYQQAVDSFATASKLLPENILPLGNASLAFNAMGQNDSAENSLRQALALEPENLAALLNLGMLLGELGRTPEAEMAFRSALKADPKSAVAAYNLGVLLAGEQPQEAIKFCRQAYQLQPGEPKYGYTYAYFLMQADKVDQAEQTLRLMIEKELPAPEAYLLLAEIYTRQKKTKEAADVYRRAIANQQFDKQIRDNFDLLLQRINDK